jgi:fumarate reductase subunit C
MEHTMSANPFYTLYHPKWYRRPVSVWWWLERWCYARFVLRELTSLFVGFAALVYLWQLRALARGPDSYAGFVEAMKTPLMLSLHALTLAAALFHAFTWFHLAPRAMVLRIGGKKLPDRVVVGLNYGMWLAASFTVAWIWLRG